MSDLNVIDQFLATFIAYIDSGFGLLKGDVGHLTSILIAIDVTIAGVFWALDGEGNVLGKLVKKVLYVGAFAFILNNFKTLANLIFQSFSQLGLDASANTVSAADLLKPGKLAGIGFEAAHPLLEQVANLVGLDTFFSNFLTIFVLLVAWLIVLLAFFVLAIQLFITVLEFKLTTLAGFVVVPFAFWNKTAFLAERVLGNVITSGIKVMVLAVIVGIGSSYFGQFVGALKGQEADINQAMSLVLASLTILGLGIFGPGIASGLVSGAPQLGAGAALGTVGAAAGAGMLAGGAVMGAARAIAGAGGSALGALKAASSMGRPGGSPSGSGGGNAPSGGPAPKSAGGSAGGTATSGQTSAASKSRTSPEQSAPDWARKMQDEQRLRSHLHMAQAAIAAGDQPVASANPDLSHKE
ncbi:P-type conjugative transfer protein TrbL [Asticcacaulis solisilvae]|uniref:P-type conjugative transfer protein TrbL n=1 Tax=Asticcacaulis solisilvae TaxID=1217274 RepID=UPI003FD77B7E